MLIFIIFIRLSLYLFLLHVLQLFCYLVLILSCNFPPFILLNCLCFPPFCKKKSNMYPQVHRLGPGSKVSTWEGKMLSNNSGGSWSPSCNQSKSNFTDNLCFRTTTSTAILTPPWQWQQPRLRGESLPSYGEHRLRTQWLPSSGGSFPSVLGCQDYSG